MRHGSTWSYSRHGCRCPECTAAHRDAARKYRGRAAPVQPCGTEAAYARHRYHGEPACDTCLAAHALYMHRRRTVKGRWVEYDARMHRWETQRIIRRKQLRALGLVA